MKQYEEPYVQVIDYQVLENTSLTIVDPASDDNDGGIIWGPLV